MESLAIQRDLRWTAEDRKWHQPSINEQHKVLLLAKLHAKAIGDLSDPVFALKQCTGWPVGGGRTPCVEANLSIYPRLWHFGLPEPLPYVLGRRRCHTMTLNLVFNHPHAHIKHGRELILNACLKTCGRKRSFSEHQNQVTYGLWSMIHICK